MTSPDPHDLERFVPAQDEVYAQALAEIRNGRKTSHWMWFIFPQLRGLGSSPAAIHFGISGETEARAYLEHPVLGPRLIECAEAIASVEGKSAHEILGSPDDLKLRSCATLFAHVTPDSSVFRRILDKYFDGQPDPKSVAMLQPAAS